MSDRAREPHPEQSQPTWDPELDASTAPVVCPLCNELSPDPKALQQHLADVHRFGKKKKTRPKQARTTRPGQSHYMRKRETLSFFTGNFVALIVVVIVLVTLIAIAYPTSLVITLPVGLGLLILAKSGVFRR